MAVNKNKGKVKSINLVLTEYLDVFRAIKDIPSMLLIPFFCDFMFILAYLFTSSYFNSLIGEIIKNLQQFILLNAEEIFSGFMIGNSLFGVINQYPVIKSSLFDLINLTLISSIIIFIFYLFFQYYSWRYSLQLAGYSDKSISEKKSYGKNVSKKNILNSHLDYIDNTQFFKRFFFINLFWLLFIMIINITPYIHLFFDMLDGKIQGTPTFVSFFIKVFSYLIVYLAFISYYLIRKREFKIGFIFHRGFRYLFFIGAGFMVMLITLFSVNYIISFVSVKILRLLFDVFLIIPLIGIMRIYFIRLNMLQDQ